MHFKEKYGSWAAVAGSAEGLGEAWSRSLAQQGMNILMIDHQEDKLYALASLLEKEHDIETISLPLDLGDDDAWQKIMEAIQKLDCHLLIYNAAYSLIKTFTSITEKEIDNFIDINTRTQLKLVHSFSQHLIIKGGGGGIILMSSLAGLLGMHLVTPYAATKAFAWNLAEALHHELGPHKIDVMACIAGATSTPAYIKTKPKYGVLKPLVMKPEDVTEIALTKLGKKVLFIPGFSNRMNYFILTRLLPRKMASRIANNTMKKMYS